MSVVPMPGSKEGPAIGLSQIETLHTALGPIADAKAFLVWRYVRRGEKPSKIPCDPSDGVMRSPNSAADRAVLTFHDAVAAAQALNSRHSHSIYGVGVLPKRAGLIAYDLDNTSDAGALTSHPIYSELSPSGNGVRMLATHVPAGAENITATERGDIGIYRSGRFVTLTGHRTPHSASSVLPSVDAGDAIMAALRAVPAPAGDNNPPREDAFGKYTIEEAEACILQDDGHFHHATLDLITGLRRSGLAMAEVRDRVIDLLERSEGSHRREWQQACEELPRKLKWLADDATTVGGDFADVVMDEDRMAKARERVRGPMTVHEPRQSLFTPKDPEPALVPSIPTWTERMLFHEGPPDCVVPFLIPKGILTSLYGSDGLGKTSLMMCAAMCLAMGRHALGQENTTPRKIIILSGEDPERTIADRGKRIIDHLKPADDEMELLDQNLIMPDITDRDMKLFSWERDYSRRRLPFFDYIIDLIITHEPELIILDPISDLFEDNENDRSKVAPFMRELNQLAMASEVAIVMLGHPAKAEGSEFSGSTAWSSKVRSRLWLHEDEQSGHLMLQHQKASWSERASPMRIEQPAPGVFVTLSTALSDGAARMEASRVTGVVMRALRGLPDLGQTASASKHSPTYLPKLIFNLGLSEGATLPALETAFTALLRGGKLTADAVFNGEKNTPKLVRANRSPKSGVWFSHNESE